MRSYPKMSNDVTIPKNLPPIGHKITTMTYQTKADVNHFDNIRYDYNTFLIDLAHKEQSANSKMRTTFLTEQNEAFPLMKSSIKLSKTYEKHALPKLNKCKFITVNPYFDKHPETFASHERVVSYRSVKKSLFPNLNISFSNDDIKTQNSIPLNPKQKVFNSCEEIEGDCFSIRENCRKKHKRNYLKKFIRKANKIKTLGQLDELKYNKKQVGINPLMNIKIKNKRLLQESDCIEKMADDLAFKANKAINGIFTSQEKESYFTNSSYKHYDEIKKKRIQQIQELQEIMCYNEKEHSKFSSSYKNYVNKNK